MKRLIFASGGSGGHLAPAIALAQVCAQHSRCVTWIATTRKRVDQRMQQHYPAQRFVSFDSKPLVGSPLGLVRALLANLRGTAQALGFIHTQRCEAVVATGGFGCVPSLAAACLLGVPCFLHESNAIPGKVTRWFSALVHRTFVTRLMDPGRYSRRSRVHTTGFPIRQTFRTVAKIEAKQAWGMDPERPLIGVLGGSQGAQVLTQFARENSPGWLEQGIQLIAIVGPHSREFAAIASEEPVLGGAQWVDFVDDMGRFLSAVDVLIARSGAGSIAEIAQAQCPSLLVPLPSAADDHQRANARVFAASGCAQVVEQVNLEDLDERIKHLLADSETLALMKQAMQEWSACNRLDGMLAECLQDTERVL